mgnify:FL=1
MAHDVAALQSRIEELEQRLERKDVHIEALKAEVIRLRRWRFGRSAETLDPGIAPELPLAGAEAPTAVATAADATIDVARIPRLVSVDAPHATRLARRPVRALPPELPRVIRVHAPASCSCPECGDALRQLGEDTSEQLDYVPGYFQVIRHVRPKLVCRTCARIVQAAAPSRPIERGLPTAALLALLAGAKYADHCPLYRHEGV